MISLCVIAKHGSQGFKNLINSATPFCKEIVVALDDDHEPDINGYGAAKYYHRPLNRDFAGQRNFLLEQASGQWALHLDTDENLTPWLWERLTEILEHMKDDLVMLPRSTVFVDRPEHVCDWPDWQPKLHRIKPEIRWRFPVHEWPFGFNGQHFFPADMNYAIQHRKTTADQEIANQLYSQITQP